MVRGGSAARREASDRHLVLLKLLQETPMTMALSSRLASVRARWRAARDSTDSLPAQRAHSNAPAAPADCWMATVANVGESCGAETSSFAVAGPSITGAVAG